MSSLKIFSWVYQISLFGPHVLNLNEMGPSDMLWQGLGSCLPRLEAEQFVCLIPFWRRQTHPCPFNQAEYPVRHSEMLIWHSVALEQRLKEGQQEGHELIHKAYKLNNRTVASLLGSRGGSVRQVEVGTFHKSSA